MPLPPLLSERPPRVRLALMTIPSIAFGLVAGWTLGVSSALWGVANVIAIVGGVAGGFECADAGAGARRGVISGVLFGLAVVIGVALFVDHREASFAHPAILFAVVATIGGTLLGALGGALRARAERRAASATA